MTAMSNTLILAKLLEEKPGLTVEQIIESLGWTEPQVRRTLDSLRMRGAAVSLPKRYELTTKGSADLRRANGYRSERGPYKTRKDKGTFREEKPEKRPDASEFIAEAKANQHPIASAWGGFHG